MDICHDMMTYPRNLYIDGRNCSHHIYCIGRTKVVKIHLIGRKCALLLPAALNCTQMSVQELIAGDVF